MAQGREEQKKTERPADEVRFTPLDDARWEDSGYLPPDDDQSWREMEALRIAAYDRIGHLPPQDDQSWREREAMRIAAAREESETEETADQMPDPLTDRARDPESPDPVLESSNLGLETRVPLRELPPPRRGSGGVMFLLGGFVGLIVLVFAAPDLLSPDFWRAQWTATRANPAPVPQRVANVPAPLAAIRPPPTQSPPAPDNGHALNTEPSADSQPPANEQPPADAAPPADASADAVPDVAPRPRPDMRADRGLDESKTMVIKPDGTVKYENGFAAAKPASHETRDTGGVYAMAPGPDGKLRYQYFPLMPKTGSRAADNEGGRGNREPDGVYAMAPGPDGKLQYQFFPSKPPR